MRVVKTLIMIMLFTGGGLVSASEINNAQPRGPCQQITAACKAAGFVQNQGTIGQGIWHHCVNAIIQQAATVPGSTLLLPKIDPSVVSACHAKRPRFGMGKIGS